MASVPTATLRLDWFNTGAFSGPFDSLTPLMDEGNVLKRTRGRSDDFSAEALGELSFVLDNYDDRYTPDRNWHDNPSAEVDTTGWGTAAVTNVIDAAATSIAQVTDNAGLGGTKAFEVVLPGTIRAGVSYLIPYKLRAGVTYAFAISVKSVSGSTSIDTHLRSVSAGFLTSAGGGTITTSWARYANTYTPGVDLDDVYVAVRTGAASGATVRFDAIQVNAGSSANTYLEAPTRGQLVSGRPVHLYGTFSAVDYPLFYGFVERITPRPEMRIVEVTCYDVLRRLAEVDVVVPANTYVQRSPRDFAIEALADYERGTLNFIGNPSFTTNTAGWTDGGGTLTRITTDAAPGAGTACGQYVAGAVDRVVAYTYSGSAPLYFAGQVYRGSIWAKAAGTQTWILRMQIGATITSKTITVTTAWQRFTVTILVTATLGATSASPSLSLTSTANDTIKIDAAQVTRGQALYPYSDVGTGRYPNFVGNGSFDGGALNGWYDAWHNIVTNPGFEVNATGYVNATRLTTAPYLGAGHGNIASATTATYNLAGTFFLGNSYKLRVQVRSAGAGNDVVAKLLSSGTPADVASSGTVSVAGAYQEITVLWAPTANRADPQISIQNLTGVAAIYIDAVQVTRRDIAAVADPAYSDTGPGGGGSFTTTADLDTTVVKWGSTSHKVVSPATSTAGRIYDFNHIGAIFRSGQAYTGAVWIRATSAMPYKIGIGANKGDGTWDEASTTGTLSSNTWTQVTFTWTPSADRYSTNPFDIVLYVLQTNGTARTYYLDGVRVIPGSTADDFEMAGWLIDPAAMSGTFPTSVSFQDSLLAVLSTLNALTLTRMWSRPLMATPFYELAFEDRDAFAAKAVAETITEDIAEITDLEIDRSSIINVIPIAYGSTTEYYSDSDSVAAYGVRPTSPLGGGGSYYTDRTVPDTIGAALLARYKNGVRRPRVKRSQAGVGHVARDLSDLLDLTVDRFLVRHLLATILTEELTISQSGLQWDTALVTEEFTV